MHVRPACPPLVYGCKFLNFSRSKSDLDLITRRIIQEAEGRKLSGRSACGICRSGQLPLCEDGRRDSEDPEFYDSSFPPSG